MQKIGNVTCCHIYWFLRLCPTYWWSFETIYTKPLICPSQTRHNGIPKSRWFTEHHTEAAVLLLRLGAADDLWVFFSIDQLLLLLRHSNIAPRCDFSIVDIQRRCILWNIIIIAAARCNPFSLQNAVISGEDEGPYLAPRSKLREFDGLRTQYATCQLPDRSPLFFSRSVTVPFTA